MFKSFFKNEIIEFLCKEEDFEVLPKPYPARKGMPDWYRKITPYVNGKDRFGAPGMSAKKCMPLIDGMSLGFIIPLAGDVTLRSSENRKAFEVLPNPYFGNLIDFHSVEQLGITTSPTYPSPAVKFINKWIIKTAPGYSTLFIPCMNHMDPRFTVLGALVDTDTYQKEVNFPAVWHLFPYEDVIKAGTPIITAIPIKRDDQPKEVIARPMTKKEEKRLNTIFKQQESRSSVYSNELRADRNKSKESKESKE